MQRLARIFALLIPALAVTATSGSPASADPRRALVIGINAYREITPLEKATGDAEALKTTLESLGFSVDLVLDADRRTMNRAISEFQNKLQPGDTALIHFSGHGVEIDGQNYLLPADIPTPQSGQQDFVRAEAISLGDLMQRMATSGAATRIFIIDACRDNPFVASGARGLGGVRGLTRVDAPAGTFILYSAGYRQSALDRLNDTDQEPTSVYTRVLIKKMTEPGRQLAELARDIRSDVEALARKAGHEQRPAYYDELSGRFFFKEAVSGDERKESPQASTVPPPPLPQPSLNERDAFETARGIDTKSAWDAFLKRFPSGFYADMARAARGKLARPETPLPAALPSLELAEGKAWLVIASRDGLSEAKELAQQFAQKFRAVMVVRTTNSRYAVTLGWGTEHNLAHHKQVLATAGSIAADSYLTHGAQFVEPVWTQENWHTLLASDRERFLDRATFETRCRVMDPTGTPLNLRTNPNGKIIGTLQNGMLVGVTDQSFDRHGKPWAYIKNYETDKTLGWVFLEFLACP